MPATVLRNPHGRHTDPTREFSLGHGQLIENYCQVLAGMNRRQSVFHYRHP